MDPDRHNQLECGGRRESTDSLQVPTQKPPHRTGGPGLGHILGREAVLRSSGHSAPQCLKTNTFLRERIFDFKITSLEEGREQPSS